MHLYSKLCGMNLSLKNTCKHFEINFSTKLTIFLKSAANFLTVAIIMLMSTAKIYYKKLDFYMQEVQTVLEKFIYKVQVNTSDIL